MARTLIRTDKNGTKYWHNVCNCPKCGGTGIVSCYVPINGGDCYDCNGCGQIEYIDKEYTEEYLEKLEARRKKAEEKRLEKRKAEADKLNKSLFERNGYNEVTANLLVSEEDLAKNPIITEVNYNNPQKMCNYDYCEKIVITFMGESRPIAEINSESGSGSGWQYGAHVWVVCKETGETEVLTEW